jgi:hypothetical protein
MSSAFSVSGQSVQAYGLEREKYLVKNMSLNEKYLDANAYDGMME